MSKLAKTELAAPFNNIFYPSRDTVCTEPFSRFLKEYYSHLDFFFFVIQLVSKADQGRVVASKALIVAETDPERIAGYQNSIDNPDLVLKQLSKHSTVVSQNLTNGIANAFQRYFSSIINSAAVKRPELMSSSQTIRVDDVLKFNRHKDLIAFIIDRKINELSYGGLSDMEKYFDDRLGVKMFEDDRQRGLLRLLVEARNINVHNGGIVNELFVARVGLVEGFTFKKGKIFHVDMDSLASLSENAMRVAMQIDALVGAKFRLQRKAHRNWRKIKQPNGKPQD